MLQSIFSFLKKDTKTYPKGSIHSFIVTDLKGNQFDFSTLKGKKNNGCEYRIKMWLNTSIRKITEDLRKI